MGLDVGFIGSDDDRSLLSDERVWQLFSGTLGSCSAWPAGLGCVGGDNWGLVAGGSRLRPDSSSSLDSSKLSPELDRKRGRERERESMSERERERERKREIERESAREKSANYKERIHLRDMQTEACR